MHWHDYIKLKYDDTVNLCYTDTESFIINIKTEVVSKKSANGVKKKICHIKLCKWKTLSNM